MVVPFRIKIVALVVLSLALSFAAYITLGSSLLQKDRIAYVYDFNLVKLNSVATAVESRLDHAITFVAMLGKLVDDRSPAHDAKDGGRLDDALAALAKPYKRGVSCLGSVGY